MASNLKPYTGVALVNTQTNAGTITLPLTSSIPSRQITIKDSYGNLPNKTVTVNTQGSDTFEDGTTTKILNLAQGFQTFYAYAGKWYTLGGTILNAVTISSLTVSTLSGVSFLTASNILNVVSTVNTVGGIAFNNLSTVQISAATATVSSFPFVNITPAYSNLWVAVGNETTDNNTIKYSGNGINWSNSSGPGFSFRGFDVGWNGRMWVAVGWDATQNNTIKYSFDGISWLNSSGTGFTLYGYGVAWNGRQWVAVGVDSTNNNTIKYSLDGITWSNSSGQGFRGGAGRGVAWNGSMWVAVGDDSTQTMKYSFNGITWFDSPSTKFSGNSGESVAWNGRIWVAVGADSTPNNTIKHSFDGINWLNANSGGFTVTGYGVAWNGRIWVAVGSDATQNNRIKYSFDGINWLNSSGTGFTSQGLSVAWNGQIWVAVGDDSTPNNTIKYSVDGITWLNSSGAGFATSGDGIAYSSNVTPAYQQQNLSILPQNIPTFITSTNTIFAQPSSLVFNHTLLIDSLTNRVGINCNVPSVDLDINGTAEALILSSFRLNTSSLFASNAAMSSLQVNSLTIGSGTGWVNLGPLQTVALSSIQTNTGFLLASSINGQQPQSIIDANGIFRIFSTLRVTSPGPVPGIFTNMEGQRNSPSSMSITWGDGTGWYYYLRGSAARLTNIVAIEDQNGRVGINCNVPTVELDVNGTIEGNIISTLRLNTSSISFGSGAGWVQTSQLQATALSSIQLNSALGYVSSLYLGSTTTQLPGYNLFTNGTARINRLLVGQPSTLFGQGFPVGVDLQMIRASAAVQPTANTWVIFSDQRIKENIVDADLDRCYNDIKNARLRRFQYLSSFYDAVEGYDRHVLGFVAQEVSTIIPKTAIVKEGLGYSNFNYFSIDQLNMALYGAVKKTMADKEVLESTVKGQRLEIQTLQGTTSVILSTLEGLQGR